ncbi:MAG: type II secretion system F family protein, partial [Planctomycetes bacterium]|nr:type II secretion system F family protein [Planctomycetota bacterium]
ILPPDTLALIRVGAQTGNLVEALREAAVLARTRGEAPTINLHGTLTYVLAVGLVLLSISGFIMYWIVPKFRMIFNDFGIKLPEITETVIAGFDGFANYWYLSILALPAGLLLTWLTAAFLLDVLGLGPGWQRRSFPWSSRWTPRLRTPAVLRCLAVCVDAGRPLSHALQSMSDFYLDSGFRGRLVYIFDEVSRGQECWLVMRSCGMLRRGELGMLEAAQRVGNLPWVLRSIADSIERRAMYRFFCLVQLVDPLIIVVIGLFVGFFCASMFLPIISILEKLA